jgi:hypothetical protein
MIIDSKVNVERTERIQALVDAGEMAAMTTITKRPSDTACWLGLWYGGSWYPPTDPRCAELGKLRYMLPAGEVEAKKNKKVMLGEIEIEMGDSQYRRPGISVRHSVMYKRLDVCFFGTGRSGKQKNFWPLYYLKTDNMVNLTTGGAKKSAITLDEWRAFVDQVDVRVSSISENTVEMTSALIKMARDVIAFRRQAPSDAEWADEAMAVRGIGLHEARLINTAQVMRSTPEIQSQIQMVDWLDVADGYDPNCGMQSDKPWALKFMLDVAQDWMEAEVDEYVSPTAHLRPISDKGTLSLTTAAHVYLSAIGVGRASSKSGVFAPGHMRLFAMSVHAAFSRWHYPVKFAAPTPATSWTHCIPLDLRIDDNGKLIEDNEPAPIFGCLDAVALEDITFCPNPTSAVHNGEGKPATTILPQLLQSNEDVLEAIAMSKAPVPPAMVDQLVEAVEYAVEHWDNEEARILPGGYNLRSNFYNVFIHLSHPDHPNCITVGMKDTHSGKLEFVSKRGEIREYMAKVEAGMRPSDNGKLPGILFQAPIHDDDRQARGISATASPFADLPMFAEADEPGGAA